MKNRIVLLLLVSAMLVIKPWTREQELIIHSIAYDQLSEASKALLNREQYLTASSLGQSAKDYSDALLERDPIRLGVAFQKYQDAFLVKSVETSSADLPTLVTLSFLIADSHNPVAFRDESYPIRIKKEPKNLIALWQKAFEDHQETPATDASDVPAKAIALMQKYPKESFVYLDVLTADRVMHENTQVMQDHVFSVKRDENLTTNYLKESRAICEQKMVKAGYRLGAIIEATLSLVDVPKTKSTVSKLDPVVSEASSPESSTTPEDTPRRCGIM